MKVDKSQSKPIEDKDLYKIALDTRNFEISLFWQRSNYFLVLSSALAVGFFNLKEEKYALLFAAFGVFTSFLWCLVNLGSKYWQSRWEQRLYEIEKQIAPDINFFAANQNVIHSDVNNSLQFGNHKGFRKWVDIQTLRKPSVSYCMILLSFGFLTSWSLIFILSIFTN